MIRENFKINNVVVKYLCFFIVGICLFFISYSFFNQFSSSKGKRVLYNTINSISKVNNKSKSFLDNNSLDIDTALKILPQMSDDLINISSNLNSSKYIADNYNTNDYTNLIKGLSENILIIDQLNAMLNNPYGSDIELAANNLKNFRDTTTNYYSLISYKNSIFDLGLSLNSAIDLSIDYCMSSNNLRKISEMKLAESTKFISTLGELVISLENLKCDYYSKVLECRSGNLTYELLISNLNDTLLKLNSVKSVLSQMTIPDRFSSIYDDFLEIITIYNNYLLDVKYAIVTENVRRSNKDIKKDFMDSLYISSNKIYSDMEVKYKKFINEYNSLNSTY
ncbi:MAG: hypothetical protein RR636_10280 [Clostridium sp.]|uniref:hypothetical protein n=1 Tax=Clostridium sp. TaxID=1506 RepID=UPI00303977AB